MTLRIGITCYPTYGGSGIVATELGKELAARGHEIHFITYAPPLRLRAGSPNIHFHEVETTSYPLFHSPPYTLALATMMADVATAQRLDVLHCHYAIPHSVSAFLAKSMLEPLRLPVVTTLHGTDITLVGSDRSYLPITRFSIEKSDAVTAVSEYLREATYRTFGVKNEIEVIYNFVNCDRRGSERHESMRAHFAPNGERILIHLSNFRPVKRVTDVVEVFNIVQLKLPAVLLMVGDGPERSSAEHAVCSHALGSKVRFLGKRDDIEELTACSDLLLLPSDNESFGLAALEAMASAVPVLVSKVGGLPEVVTDGVDGFLIEPRNIEGMARRAIEILSDEDRRRRMGEHARETARTRFSSSAIIPQYEQLYERVLSATSA